MNKETIDKIIRIFDLEFDALFYTYIVDEKDIQENYKEVRKRLEALQ